MPKAELCDMEFRNKERFVFSPGLVLRWSGYDQTIGGVDRIMPSSSVCGAAKCPEGYTGQNCDQLLPDKTPPNIVYCPQVSSKFSSSSKFQSKNYLSTSVDLLNLNILLIWYAILEIKFCRNVLTIQIRRTVAERLRLVLVDTKPLDILFR